MKARYLLLTILLTVGVSSANDSGFKEVDGPNVRVKKHDDGSKTVFEKSPDGRTVTKRTRSANGPIVMVTIYRMDKHGNPTGCKIYDGSGTEMFKTSYGYRKSDGQLVEERMFDSRVKRIDPNTGNEMPVRRFFYIYDALGNRSAPIAITLIPGKTSEEVYGGPTALDRNLFDK